MRKSYDYFVFEEEKHDYREIIRLQVKYRMDELFRRFRRHQPFFTIPQGEKYSDKIFREKWKSNSEENRDQLVRERLQHFDKELNLSLYQSITEPFTYINRRLNE